jgi:hypothetical protein
MADRNAGSPGAPSSNDENLKEAVRLLLKKLESPAPAPSIIINNNNSRCCPTNTLKLTVQIDVTCLQESSQLKQHGESTHNL